MKESLVFIGSVTYAMKVKDILNKNGVAAILKRIQKMSTEKGCSYGIYVIGNVEKARQILKNSGINVALNDNMEGHDDLS